MKKRDKTSTPHQNLINQLLALHYSGIYINSNELIDLGLKIDFKQPSKSRELLLKNLFNEAQKDNKLNYIFIELIKIINEKIKIYKILTNDFPNINEITLQWIQKAERIIKLIQFEQRGNPYE